MKQTKRSNPLLSPIVVISLGLLSLLSGGWLWTGMETSRFDEVEDETLSKLSLQDMESTFQQAAMDLLTEQFDLTAIDHSMTISNTAILDSSARVDILLVTNSREVGKVEDLIHVFILHNNSQIQQVFREPSPEFYQFADQVPSELLPPERIAFWRVLFNQEQMSSNLASTDQPSSLYKLPFTGGSSRVVAQDYNKHFDFAGSGWLVRVARGGIAINGIDRYGAYYTRIQHADGTFGWYLHFQANSWITGGNGSTYNVSQGDCLAYTGDTGLSTGAHLHFNVSTTPNNDPGCNIATGCNPPNWETVSFTEGTIPNNGNTPPSQNSTAFCNTGCCGCTAASPTNASLFQPSFPGMESETFTPLPEPADVPSQPEEPVLTQNLPPEWPAAWETSILTSREAPPQLSWPEAAGDSGEKVEYLTYWGNDPAGTGDTAVSEAAFTPPETLLQTDEPAVYYLRVAARDESGQLSAWQTAAIWQYDPAPPTGTLSLSGAGNTTKSLPVTLELAAADDGGVVAEMRFSRNGRTWTAWEPFAAYKQWLLEESAEPQVVYAQVRDAAGNVSEVMDATITADLPVTLPASASYQIGCSAFGMSGGTKSSSSYTVHSIAGQPFVTGILQGSSYQVHSGFTGACGGSVYVILSYNTYIPLIIKR